MVKKTHIPEPGRGSGRSGLSYCGRFLNFDTGDHDLLRRQVYGDPARHCKRCLAKFNPELLAEVKRGGSGRGLE